MLLVAIMARGGTADLAAEITEAEAALFVDFANTQHPVQLREGARFVASRSGNVLEFKKTAQAAELDWTPDLSGVDALSIGGWFKPSRVGEQYFFTRGLPHVGTQGERMFPPQADWTNFCLGTDERGFFLGTIHGNGIMPFPHVTLQELGINFWHQLVVVKDARGFQKFYVDGQLVRTDEQASGAGTTARFPADRRGEPLRWMMPMGGVIGESWIFTRELTAEEIRRDFEAKRKRFHPALSSAPVLLREMNLQPAAGLWNEPISAEGWPAIRERITSRVVRVLGKPPSEKPALNAEAISEEDCGSYWRRKIVIQVQAEDRMPAYLLVPKSLASKAPAVICFYGTTSGAGKDTTVGQSGRKQGTPPHRNLSFAIDVVEAGMIALAPDYLRDGERIEAGRKPYDTTGFYERFPEWSIVGKDVWDTSRAVDYLQSLEIVDGSRIGMMGHSYGGHTTIFATALEPRIAVAVSNGPVSDFLHHGHHWAVPKGAGNSQSLPGMRPYVLDPTMPSPMTFYEFTSLIAPRPLLVGQAVGERRPREEENHAAVAEVYRALKHPERVRYHWYAGDHDFPPEARQAAIAWFQRWFAKPAGQGEIREQETRKP